MGRLYGNWADAVLGTYAPILGDRATSVLRRYVAGADYAENQLIVSFGPAAQTGDLSSFIAGLGGRVSSYLDGSFALGGSARLSFGSSAALETAMASLSSHAGIVSVEPDWLLKADAIANDPAFQNGSMWGMSGDLSTPSNAFGSQAAEAWAKDLTGSTRTVVGIIDSGIDYRHPDLYLNIFLNQGEIPQSFRSALVDTDQDGLITFRDLNNSANAAFVRDVNGTGYIDAGDLLNDSRWEDRADSDGNGYLDDLVGWDFANNDNDPFDDFRHGTHVAGTIGAVGGDGRGVAGVDWAIQMIPLKFISSAGTGTISAATQSLNYYTALAVKNAATANFVGTNNSWGGGSYSNAMNAAIVNTARAGQLFIAAAGNNSTDTDSSANYPVNYSTIGAVGYEAVIAVAALTSTGGLASFSNYGRTTVDLAAPGATIYSTLPNGAYGYFSGTSMATPHVTGALALMASAFPDLSAASLRSALLGNTAFTQALSGRVATSGRLDLGKVFDALGLPVGAQPKVTAITLSDTALAIGESATVTIRFSEAVSGFTLSDLVFDAATGALANLVQDSGDAKLWTAQFTPAAGVTDATNTVAIAAGSYTSLGGAAGAAGASANFTIDTLAPAITSIALSRTAIGIGQTATLTVAFSEAVSGLTLADFTYDTATGTLGNLVQLAGTNQWQATFTPLGGVSSASGTIALAAGSYTDLAGNAGPGTQSPSFSVETPIDATAPVVEAITLSDTALRIGETASVTIRFSEEVTGLTLSDLTLDGAVGTLGNLVKGGQDPTRWTALFTPGSNITDAANMIAIASGSFTDLSGNPGAGGQSAVFAIDTAAPTTTSFQLSAASLAAGQSATLAITFSEAVTGLALSDFSFNAALGTLDNLQQVSGTNQWTAIYTAAAGAPSSSNNTISLVAGSYADEAGNGGAARVSSPFAVVGAAPAANMIYGTVAGDVLVGTAGNDIISGLPASGGTGTGTIDRLTGGGGNDRFILGDSRGMFYNDGRGGTSGTGDYALITDFRPGDGVQLSSGYQYFLMAGFASGIWKTDIYADTDRSGRYNSGDELIGVLQGITAVSLSSATFEGVNYTIIS
ncbi:MAG: S8 family serine peptidase [Novosphingobium sp.]|nr:S8 family serine peptidase [Novosphingobium sp.]